MTYDLALENGTVCTENGLFPANVYVEGEEIRVISSIKEKLPAKESIDCSGLFLLPGFIDPHVHLGLALGRYTSADNFESGSALALSGGVTTLIDFLDPISDLAQLEAAKRDRMTAAKDSRVDYSFHVTLAGNPSFSAEEIARSSVAAKMPSIKVFTTYSSSGRRSSDGMIYSLLSLSRKLGFVLMAHSENDEIIREREKEFSRPTYRDISSLRPTISELSEVAMLSLISLEEEGQLYIVHVSSGKTVEALSSLGLDWRRFTKLETCPQYLLLNNDPLKTDQGYLNTYCPPPRTDQERALLQSALRKGEISSIGTDHCPFLNREKWENRDDYPTIPNGTGSLGISFATINTILDGDLKRVSSLLSTNPARIFGLFPKRGVLAPGSIANIAIVDRDVQSTVSRSRYTRSDHSLFEGIKLRGSVETVIHRGKLAFKNGDILLPKASGRFIERENIYWEKGTCR